ncbi:MAG TPA: cytochrome C [Gammaproteobacteria bacterium]|nr:cytochrome C [Gammaproteobacteria bacterium]
MDKARIKVYLDDNPEPIADYAPPASFKLDTTELDDGPHRLVVRARDGNGTAGLQEMPFKVRNGPGISISGLRPHQVRRGIIDVKVNAFSADEPFSPRRAESRSPVPIWVWVLGLVVVGWAGWYGSSLWHVPADYANTPTYAAQPAAPAAADESKATGGG